jgi:hypothetical protein
MPVPAFLGGFGISSLIIDWYESSKTEQHEGHGHQETA